MGIIFDDTSILGRQAKLNQTNNINSKSLGSRIREARKATINPKTDKPYKQNEAIEIIGVNKNTFCNYEAGSTSISLEKLVMIANLFDKPLDYFVGRDELFNSLESRGLDKISNIGELLTELYNRKICDIKEDQNTGDPYLVFHDEYYKDILKSLYEAGRADSSSLKLILLNDVNNRIKQLTEYKLEPCEEKRFPDELIK